MKGYDTETAGDAEVAARLDLLQAISQLTLRQQAIIALRCEGFTQQAITDLLGVSRTTVWMDEKESHKILAQLLGPQTIEVSGEEA